MDIPEKIFSPFGALLYSIDKILKHSNTKPFQNLQLIIAQKA
jgi:hypothetical protein